MLYSPLLRPRLIGQLAKAAVGNLHSSLGPAHARSVKVHARLLLKRIPGGRDWSAPSVGKPKHRRTRRSLLPATVSERTQGGGFLGSSIRILLPGSTANLAVQALLLLCGLGTGTVTARILGPVQRGELSFLVLVPSVFTVIGSLGVEYGTYYLWHHERGKLRPQILAAGLFVTTLSGVLCAVVAFAVVLWFEPRAGLSSAFLVAVGVPMSVANAILTMALMANRRMLAYNISRLVGPILYTAIIGGLCAVGALSATRALVAWFCSIVLTVAVNIAMVAWMGSGLPRWDIGIVRQVIGYGLRSYVGSVSQYGTLQLDQGLLVVFVGNVALGTYYVAVTMGQVVLYLATNISSAMMGQFSDRSRAQQRRLAVAAVAAAVVGTAAVVALLFLVGGPVIALVLGRAYLSGLTPLRILLPGLVFLAAARVMSGYFIAIGQAQVFARAALASLIVTVVGDVVLIPEFQASGAALASTVAYGLMAAWLWRTFRAGEQPSRPTEESLLI